MQFDNDFFDSIGLADASDEEKQKLVEQLATMVQDRLALRLSEVLTDEQGDRFADLIDEGKEDEAFAYLEEAYPEYGQLVQEEMDKAKAELIENMKTVIGEVEQQQAAQGGGAEELVHDETTPAPPPADQHANQHHVQHDR